MADMSSRLGHALIGIVSTALALGVGHLLAAALSGQNASPFVAVGNTAIDLTPEPVKHFAINQFGESDKMVLLAGMAVVITLVAAVAGFVSRTTPLPGLIVITAFGLLGMVAAVARPNVGAAGVLPALAATIAGVGSFAWLHRIAHPRRESAQRRQFLLASAGVAAGALVSGLAGARLAGTRGMAEATRNALRGRVPTPPATPAGADFAKAGTPTFVTPNKDFYRVDIALAVPQVDANTWRLRVHGMVNRELTLSLDDLLRRPQVSQTITMTCVSNEVGGPYISNATFTGVPIRDILLEAGVRPGAQQVFSTSVDGFTAGTPVDVLLQPGRDALLAFGMNGEPLPAEHGFPVRMVTAGLYGFVSATKWLVDMELTTFDRATYWQQRGWAKIAPIKTQSRIDRPAPFEKVRAGRYTAAGIAWAQPRGIERVEVRVDNGQWIPAQLSTEVNGNTWRMWRADVDLPPGGHTLECRATDRTGYTQTPQRVPTIPDGATGWHSIFCTAQ